MAPCRGETGASGSRVQEKASGCFTAGCSRVGTATAPAPATSAAAIAAANGRQRPRRARCLAQAAGSGGTGSVQAGSASASRSRVSVSFVRAWSERSLSRPRAVVLLIVPTLTPRQRRPASPSCPRRSAGRGLLACEVAAPRAPASSRLARRQPRWGRASGAPGASRPAAPTARCGATGRGSRTGSTVVRNPPGCVLRPDPSACRHRQGRPARGPRRGPDLRSGRARTAAARRCALLRTPRRPDPQRAESEPPRKVAPIQAVIGRPSVKLIFEQGARGEPGRVAPRPYGRPADGWPRSAVLDPDTELPSRGSRTRGAHRHLLAPALTAIAVAGVVLIAAAAVGGQDPQAEPASGRPGGRNGIADAGSFREGLPPLRRAVHRRPRIFRLVRRR